MELLEAIQFVLKQNKKPMHFKELAKIIHTQKLVEKGAQTLETIINTKLALEIKKCERKKIDPVFLKFDNGLIGLKVYEDPKPAVKVEETAIIPPAGEQAAIESITNPIDELIAKEMEKVKALYIEKLQTMSFLSFERIFENFLRQINFIKYTVVNRRTDGGIDYAVNLSFLENNVNMLAVIRRWPVTRKFTFKNVDEIINTMSEHKFNMAVIVLFSELDNEVKQYIKEKSKFPIFCINSSALCDIFMSRGIGITAKTYTSCEFNNEYVKKIEEEIAQKIENHKKNGKNNLTPNQTHQPISVSAAANGGNKTQGAAEHLEHGVLKQQAKPGEELKISQAEQVLKQPGQNPKQAGFTKDEHKDNRAHIDNKNANRNNRFDKRHQQGGKNNQNINQQRNKDMRHENRPNAKFENRQDGKPNSAINETARTNIIQPLNTQQHAQNAETSRPHISETAKTAEPAQQLMFNEQEAPKTPVVTPNQNLKTIQDQPDNTNKDLTNIITEPVKINTIIPSAPADINIVQESITPIITDSGAAKITGSAPVISNVPQHSERRISQDASKPFYKKKYNPKNFHKNYSKRSTIHKGN